MEQELGKLARGRTKLFQRTSVVMQDFEGKKDD